MMNFNRTGYDPIPAAATSPRPMHRMSSGEERTRSRIVAWTALAVMLLTLPTILVHYQNDWSRVEPEVSTGRDDQSGTLSYDDDNNNNNNNNNNDIGDLRSWAQEDNEDDDEEVNDLKQHSNTKDRRDNPSKIITNKDVKELFYHHQKLDHFRDDNYNNNDDDSLYWSNRYYQTTQYWKGPGYPIFVIIGGEGATDDGFFYPFITEHLAKHFGAAVLQIEHRFYGPYVPLVNATTSQMLQYMTVPQALADMVRLTQHVRTTDFQCSPHRTSPHYCPVITVGGSYPGALSALLRIVYPEFIDMAYAASAPLLMYAQSPLVNPNVYYDIVTEAADTASPGCAAAVRQTLYAMKDTIWQASSLEMAAQAVHVCSETIPDYIVNRTMLADALVEIASFKFADDDMDVYPPGNHTALYKTCQIFQTSDQPLKDFLFSLLPSSNVDSDESTPVPTCFDLRSQIPKDGTTLDDTDGDYHDGRMWDWQTCTDLIFVMGFSSDSMFPPKPASYEDTARHCRERFGVTPRPYQLVEQWQFDDLTRHSYILFTNGEQDLWSGGSVMYNVSDTVLALNFPNGAHHSDLSHVGPSTTRDSPDVQAGFGQIQTILGTWLVEVKQLAHT